MKIIMALLAGLIFGIGLILSGMTDPSKVIGFLDLAGNWNPSLMFVMGGAVLVGTVAFHFARSRTKALLGDVMRMPTARDIDAPLVLGSLTFGVGWGLAGYCPGPALVSAAQGHTQAMVFLAAMLIGMAIYELYKVATTWKIRHTG